MSIRSNINSDMPKVLSSINLTTLLMASLKRILNEISSLKYLTKVQFYSRNKSGSSKISLRHTNRPTVVRSVSNFNISQKGACAIGSA